MYTTISMTAAFIPCPLPTITPRCEAGDHLELRRHDRIVHLPNSSVQGINSSDFRPQSVKFETTGVVSEINEG